MQLHVWVYNKVAIIINMYGMMHLLLQSFLLNFKRGKTVDVGLLQIVLLSGMYITV